MLDNKHNVKPSIFDFLSKLEIDPANKNFGLLIRNLNAIVPDLTKIDVKREFFSVECEAQLHELSSMTFGPFKPLKKGVLGNQLNHLLVHITEYEMKDDVCYLTALFIYSQLNKGLLTGHTASPLVKTNRLRLRVFIEQVSKHKIVLNDSIETENGLVDAEKLLATVIKNDKIEEHKKTAILLSNIYKAIKGNHNFSIMNKKKSGPTQPKLNQKQYKGPVKSKSGGSKKTPKPSDITDIYNFSKTVYADKPEIEASSAVVHQVYETTETALFERKEANRHTQTKSAIENNYPQNHRRVLKNKEAKHFYTQLIIQYEQHHEFEQKKAILGMLFVLLIGLDDTWLSDIVIVDEINNFQFLNKRKILISKTGHVQFQQIELPHAYLPKKQNLAFLASQENQIITLPLPKSLISLLIDIKSMMYSSEFKIDKDIYDIEFNKMRSKLKRRFTNDKLREFTFNLYYRQSNEDEVYATLLKPVSPYLIPSSCYYASANLDTLVKTHTEAFTKVFGECVPNINTENNIYIGSKLCIDTEKIKTWFATLQAEVKKTKKGNRTLDALILAHNNFVLYVSTLLLFTTSHRPVTDIFHDRNHIFIDDGFALISDKSVDINHNLRLVTLCYTAKKHLKYYIKHLNNISNRISKFDMNTAGKLKALTEPNKKQSLPFLLLLNIDKNGEIKTSGVNKKTLEHYWKDLKLPANFYRHFMNTALKENGNKRELINFFMGHFLTGQNVLSPSSPIKTKLLIEKLSTEVEKVANALDLRALKGISSGNLDIKEANKEINIQPIFPKKQAFGITKRLEKTKGKLKEAKQLASAYITQKHPVFFNDSKKALTKSSLNKIKDYTMQEGKGLNSLILNEFNKAIKKRARLSNRKPERLFFMSSGHEKSALADGFAIHAQQYLVFKTTISKIAINEIAYSNISEKKCVDKLIWVYLHCLSIDLPYDLPITDFYHLIKQPHGIVNNAVYFEYYFKSHGVIRYFPNNLSTMLIRKLKSNLSKTAPSKKTTCTALAKIMTALHKQNSLIPTSLTQLKKVAETGWIFNESPAFHAQRKLQVFHALPVNIRNLEKNND